MYYKEINQFLKLQKEKKRLKKRLFFTIIGTIIIFLLCLLKIHQHTELIQLGYKYTSLIKKKEELKEKNIRLKAELARLTSCQRIKRLAEDIGFKLPTSQDILNFVYSDNNNENWRYESIIIKTSRKNKIWAMSKPKFLLQQPRR
jgi:cell division protein FtsL